MIKLVAKIFIFLFLITQFSFASYIDTDAEMAVVIDADTGKVLFEKDKDKKTFPASMTKIMTTLIVFEKLSNGTLTLDDKFLVSERAWKEREGSSMFVEIDKEIRVEDLLRGIIVQSGNDACIVIAENIAGTEDAFAKMMTNKGVEIGLNNTNFTNSTGMHNPKNYSTVHDIALLSQYLINEFPKYYHLFAETEFEWSGIKQKNRNPLLYKNMGVDGLKTGHLSKSGYGLAASAIENGRRIISVANGFETKQKRSQGSSRLITWAFREFDNIKLFDKNSEVGFVKIQGANKNESTVSTLNDIVITVAKSKKNAISYNVIPIDVVAPVKSGEIAAQLEVIIPKEDPIFFDLIVTNDVKQTNFIMRFINMIYNFILSLFS
tara:strand:+ start:2852 stop:3985 length:1134 start_codon:yes stop_codon:yes gene_type:complete